MPEVERHFTVYCKSLVTRSVASAEFQVLIDNAYVATVSSEAFRIPPREEFTVPLLVEFPTSKLFQENDSGLFGAVLKQVLNNRVVVNFKGDLTYDLAGFSFDYPIDHSEEIILK